MSKYNFTLDERLQNDCHVMGLWQNNLLLLMDNALYPWLILVPDTMQTEFYRLEQQQQLNLLQQINQLSDVLIRQLGAKKLNIATIGNVVSQMHIHVIGRSPEDHCWPSVTWGNPGRTAYTQEQLIHISQILKDEISNQYISYSVQTKPGVS